MRGIYYIYMIQGALFMYLLFNFFTKEYNYYRNAILLTFIIGYSLQAILAHLHKNGKI